MTFDAWFKESLPDPHKRGTRVAFEAAWNAMTDAEMPVQQVQTTLGLLIAAMRGEYGD